METIILASGSERRREILEKLGIPFRVMVPQVDESKYEGFGPRTQVTRLAEDKAGAILSLLDGEYPAWIAGFDTLVAIGGTILGKPRNRDDARRMIRLYSGRTHSVYSGIAIIYGKQHKLVSNYDVSKVRFRHMSEQEIEFYLDTGEWKNVAGAYRIQERASFFIDRIKGSYSNIVGLPISVFYAMLRDANYTFS